jgi:Ca-activated chloride channel family protein
MRERRERRERREERKRECRGMAVSCPMLAILLLTICLLIPLSVPAASLSGTIKEGNRYYKQGDYDKALEKYEAAGEASPDSDIVNLNKGTAYYQKGQYKEAIDSFTKALNTEDKKTESDAIYNIANARYKLGSVNAENDINSAVSLYRESLDYYKRAIELDEGNRDAKYNHELVERELKVLLDKLKNQEQQQDDQEKEQDNDKKEEQKSDSKESESNESKEEEKQQDQEARDDQEMKEEKDDQKQAGEEDTGQEQEGGRQEEKNGGMSPEEARMLLEAFGEEEARDAAKKQKGARYPRVLKDW